MGIFSRLKALEAHSKLITQALIDTGIAKKQSSTAAAAGADYLTSIAGGNPTYGKTFSARIEQVDDVYKSGRVKVICNAVMGEEPFDCKMATSFGGAGYGFFNVPGIGAMVLITEVEGEGWVWFACLANLELEPGGENTITQPKGSDDEAKKVESPVPYAKYGQQDGDPKMLTHGVPEGFVNYKDNHQPEQYIWKSPKGNKIVLSEKHTEEAEEKHITIKSAMGKMILLDDADPRTDIGTEPSVPMGATGDRIIIADGEDFDVDGGPNRIWIQTSAGEDGVEDSIQVYAKNALFLETREGNINLSILDQEAEDAHILITNLAKGNLEIDIEEGDIAAVARYRICLNAWNEDESVDPETGIPKILGSVGIRSKGAFTVRNGMGSVNQNLQMSHKKGWVTLNSGKQGLALFGQPGGVVTGAVKRAHLMGTDVYVTAKDHLHLEANKITINGKTISISDNVTMPSREFDAEYNNAVPDSLSPCREIETDTGFSAQTGGGGGAGGGGGEEEGPTTEGGGRTGEPPMWDFEGAEGPSAGVYGEFTWDFRPLPGTPPTPGGASAASGDSITSALVPAGGQSLPYAPSTPAGALPSPTSGPYAPSTPGASMPGRNPYAPSTPGHGGVPGGPPVPNIPKRPDKPRGPATPGTPAASAPNIPNSPGINQAVVEYAIENDIPMTHISFNDGITPGGPGAGEGGGGPFIDDDMSLGSVVDSGGGGGGLGNIYGEEVTVRSTNTGQYTGGVNFNDGGEDDDGIIISTDKAGGAINVNERNRPTPVHSLNAQVGWFQTTARTFDTEEYNRDAMTLKTNKGLESQGGASITPNPITSQTLPGEETTASQGASNTSTGAKGPTYTATQYYLPPGGGEAGDAGGVP